MVKFHRFGEEGVPISAKGALKFKFHTFGEDGVPISPKGAFRDNIRLFLKECCVREDYKVGGMSIWCTILELPNSSADAPLYTIQEDVNLAQTPFCDYCTRCGWGTHFVCKRKYHMIIPASADWSKRLQDGFLHSRAHILHCIIHCNGYGHLVSINGREGGSHNLRGRETMDLWDRMCSNLLRVRAITIEDFSRKRSMDLRLLYVIGYGHTWFGRWGYSFLSGNFGVTEEDYVRAVNSISTTQLDAIVEDLKYTGLIGMISLYRKRSESQLTSVRDLVRFILTMKCCQVALKKQLAVDAAEDMDISPPGKKKADGSEGEDAEGEIPFGADFFTDLEFLYCNALSSQETIGTPLGTILDSIYFVKEWPIYMVKRDWLFSHISEVVPVLEELEEEELQRPGEVVVLPLDASVGDFKEAATAALRDSYCMLEEFVVREVEESRYIVEDCQLLHGLYDCGEEIMVKGNGADMYTELRYEGSLGYSKARCVCGTQEEDGESMMTCTMCGVKQHTKCIGTEQEELTVCRRCWAKTRRLKVG